MRKHAIERKDDVAQAASVREPRLTELAYAAIKAKVLDNELAPGSQVLEQALAEEIGLSRTPVREALVRLQQEGLVSIVPRHGVRISALAPSDMRDIYQVLLALEPAAIELLTRQHPSRADLADLVRACDSMEQALAASPPALKVWAEADETFHMSLARLCGNKRLTALIMTVWEQAHRARMFTLPFRPLPSRSTAEHRAVVEVVLAGDAVRARTLYEAHRRRGGEEMMAIIERHGLQHL